MSSQPESPTVSLTPHGVLETALYVDDLAIAEQFYTSLLGLEKHSLDPQRHLFYYCGSGMLLLFLVGATNHRGLVIGGGEIPAHGAVGPGHVAFRIWASEIEPWKARLAAAGVPLETEIVWPQGGHSLYFRDPSGNSLELATSQLWGLAEP